MATSYEQKKKPGDIYVVTNNCFKEVEAKGRYKGQGKVAPIKIGRGVEFENRVGSLSAAVCDDFIFHLVLFSNNSVQSEAELHDKFGDSRLRTTCKCSTEFFAAPIGDVLKRIRKFAKGNGLVIKHDFGVVGRALGSSACSIKAALKKLESCNKKCGVKSPKKQGKTKTMIGAVAWHSKLGLARLIAIRAGNEGAKDGVAQYFAPITSKVRKPCHLDSKWRKPLEAVGVKFDKDDYVKDWKCAKNPL